MLILAWSMIFLVVGDVLKAFEHHCWVGQFPSDNTNDPDINNLMIIISLLACTASMI
jgi:hypothetical protein